MEKVDIKRALEELTIEEKRHLLGGKTQFSTYDIPRLNIPSINLTDGPNGVRTVLENDNTPFSSKVKSTVFPTGSILSCSFDEELFYKVGQAIAKECIYYNKHILLGPAINIKRNPLCGRNFEYLSEDPYLDGVLASAYINGVQDQKVGVSVKHYLANNCEKNRHASDSIIDDKALHEIYLKPYEIVCKKSKPATFMSSYNKVNGVHMSENKELINGFLRGEAGFEGFLMTDWGGMVNRDKSLNAGNDIETPGNVKHNTEILIKAVKDGTVSLETLNKSVERVLSFINDYVLVEKEEQTEEVFKENYKVALEAVIDSAVLLKNENNILPLKQDKKLLVVGDLFEQCRYQGNGSSLLNPSYLKTYKMAFDENSIDYTYIKGYLESDKLIKKDVKKIKKIVQNYDYILFFGGQTDFIESEGFDRPTMDLPKSEIELLDILVALGKPIIFILNGGSSVTIPHLDKIDALVYMGLSGEAIGEGLYKLLFGYNNFSGRLSETWVKDYKDVPFGNEFTKNTNELYKESIYVGYRYYESVNKEVNFPFGYGLSYSEFKYSDFKVDVKEDKVVARFNIENVSDIAGKEVYQIYVKKPDSKTYRPIKNLVKFGKTLQNPHEMKEIEVKIDFDDLKSYDLSRKKFVLEDEKYIFVLAKNAHDSISEVEVEIKGETIEELPANIKNLYSNPNDLLTITDEQFKDILDYKFIDFVKPKKPYDMETSIEYMNTFMAKILKLAVRIYAKRAMKKARKIKDPIQHNIQYKSAYVILKAYSSMNIRNAYNASGGTLSYNQAQGLVYLVNGKLFKGIKYLTKKDEESIK